MDYWPAPPNSSTSNPITDHDPHNPNGIAITGWNSDRFRGYMAYLAFGVQWPGWTAPYPGALDQTTYYSNGMNNFGMAKLLNWEASGHNSSTWQNYFYVPVFWNYSSPSGLHDNIVQDITNSHVPVVAEVDMNLMPNWPEWNGTTTWEQYPGHHFITIIGYDDYNGLYAYTDTCANSTSCGSKKDGGVNRVTQTQMWNAIHTITPVPYDTLTGGDGGWIW